MTNIPVVTNNWLWGDEKSGVWCEN